MTEPRELTPAEQAQLFEDTANAIGDPLGVKFTKAQRVEVQVELPLPPKEATPRVVAAVESVGTRTENPDGVDDGSIRALVMSGFFSMVPAHVVVLVTSNGTGGSTVRVWAAGQEGLIKQGVARKAAKKVVDAINAGG